MDPFFTEEQLNNMSRENMMEVMRMYWSSLFATLCSINTYL